MKRFLVLALLLWAAPLPAVEIYDNARLFSSAAVADSKQRLQEFENKLGMEVIVETVAEASQKSFASETAKNRFFQEMLKVKANAREARGVYVLVCKTPGRIQVDVTKKYLDLGIGPRQLAVVRDAGLVGMRAKDPDKALIAMTSEIIQLVPAAPERASSLPVGSSAPATTSVLPATTSVLPATTSVLPATTSVLPAATPEPPAETGGYSLLNGFLVLQGFSAVVLIGFLIFSPKKTNQTTNDDYYRQRVRDSMQATEIPSTACHACGATVTQSPCPFCKAALPIPKLVSEPNGSGRSTIHNHYHGGSGGSSSDPLTTALMVNALSGNNQHHHYHDAPSHHVAADPSPSHDSSPSSSYDSGSSYSGGFDSGPSVDVGSFDWGGSVGGDF